MTGVGIIIAALILESAFVKIANALHGIEMNMRKN